MPSAKNIKKSLRANFLIIAVIFLFLLFFSALHWNSFNSPWERDEGEYAYSAWLIQRGESPYLHSFLQKPPLIIYTYYLGQLIKPFALWPPRLLGFIFTLASCILLSLTAKKLYGSKAGWLALWISPLLLSFPPICALAANTEKFMLLPLIGLAALFIFKYKKENKWTYFWAGILAAAAVLYKPIALPPAAILIIYWLALDWRSGRKIKNILINLGFIFLGAALITFLSLLYFIILGAGGELWRQVIVYNAGYASDMKKYFPVYFLHYSGIFWNSWWPLFLIAITSFIFRPKFFGLWWSLLLISLLSIVDSVGHYYLLIMPFLILISAGAYSGFSEKIKIKKPEWAGALLAAVIIFIISVSWCLTGEQFFLNPGELSAWIYGRENPFPESTLMAEKIRQNTKEGDKIFVGGSEPQLYFFSRRESVSKFDITYPLNIKTVWRQNYQQQTIEEINQNNPAAIVISRRPASGLWDETSPRFLIDYLTEKLEKNYQLIGAAAWDQQNKIIWLEPGDIDNRNDISLILYLKK